MTCYKIHTLARKKLPCWKHLSALVISIHTLLFKKCFIRYTYLSNVEIWWHILSEIQNQGHIWDAKFYHAPEPGKLRSNSKGDAAICRPSIFLFVWSRVWSNECSTNCNWSAGKVSRSSVAAGLGGMSLGIHRVPYEQQMCLDKSQLVHKSIKANSEHQALISQIVVFFCEDCLDFWCVCKTIWIGNVLYVGRMA